VALVASTCAIGGAFLGLALPTNVIQIGLGVAIIAIACLLARAKNVDRPEISAQDAIGLALGISGSYYEAATGEIVDWRTHRTLPGLIVFIGVGIMAGMFGLGAGWANVPALNLILGAPLKISVATSNFLISITAPSAAWVYLNRGCVIPVMALPSIVGLMLGALVGAKLLSKVNPKTLRYVVLGVLFFAGGRALLKGLGIA